MITKSIGSNIAIELPDSWKDYFSSLGKSHRQNISRRTRALERDFKVEVIRLGLDTEFDPDLLDKVLDDAIAVCSKSWQGSHDTGVAIDDPIQLVWFRDSSHRMARKGMLDVSVMYLDETPVSFIWGAARHPYASIATLGFDPKYKARSPGLVHLARMLEDSVDRGLKTIDFGHEFSEYKSKWSKESQELLDVYYFPHPLTGRGKLFLQRRLSRTTQGIRSLIHRWLPQSRTTGANAGQ